MEDLEAFADLVERFIHDYEGEEVIHTYEGGKEKTGRKYRIRDYIYCLEKGKLGGRCHIHLVTGQRIEWDEIKTKWSELHGIECHVKYESIHHNGMERIGWYVGKYMAKEKRVPGMRMLRSSAGLSKKISEFYEEKKELPIYVLKSKEYSRETDYNRPEDWQCPSV